MTIDLDEGAERDDLAHPHLLTPIKRLHTIAQILADGIRRHDLPSNPQRPGGLAIRASCSPHAGAARWAIISRRFVDHI